MHSKLEVQLTLWLKTEGKAGLDIRLLVQRLVHLQYVTFFSPILDLSTQTNQFAQRWKQQSQGHDEL